MAGRVHIVDDDASFRAAIERRDHMRTVGDRAYKEAVSRFLKGLG